MTLSLEYVVRSVGVRVAIDRWLLTGAMRSNFSPNSRGNGFPIARFICRQRRKTFSLLPIQLIPYFQYTVGSVVGALLLGIECWQRGQKGFYGASVKVDEVDPDSLLTPWLITCWLVAVVQGLRRGHAMLRQFYDLEVIQGSGAWGEVATYFEAFGLRPKVEWISPLMELVYCYSQRTGQFLFGTPSQYRGSVCP